MKDIYKFSYKFMNDLKYLLKYSIIHLNLNFKLQVQKSHFYYYESFNDQLYIEVINTCRMFLTFVK